jgi:hypothetical protein
MEEFALAIMRDPQKLAIDFPYSLVKELRTSNGRGFSFRRYDWTVS